MKEVEKDEEGAWRRDVMGVDAWGVRQDVHVWRREVFCRSPSSPENKLLFFAQMFFTRPPLPLNYMSTFKLSDGKESATIS
jgi:hypothetical protein